MNVKYRFSELSKETKMSIFFFQYEYGFLFLPLLLRDGEVAFIPQQRNNHIGQH